MKTCTGCGDEKPLTDFHWSNREKTRKHGKCRPCRRAQFKVWRQSPTGREWKRRQTCATFGIDAETYAKMFEQQGGVCAICLGPEQKKRSGKLVALAVDHDHDTGEVRGLLCHKCNSGLGAFRDDPALIERALSYLRKT